jgi:hypothetical protein
MFHPYYDEGWDFEWDLIHFNVGLHNLKYIVDGKLDPNRESFKKFRLDAC